MAKFHDGSEWVSEQGLDPQLARLDNEQFMLRWTDRLAALGSAALGMFKFESNDIAYCNTPMFCAFIPINRDEPKR